MPKNSPKAALPTGTMPLELAASASKHYPLAAEATRILQTNNFKAYLIGGAVRDLLLGYEPKDYDIVTNATPTQIAAIPAFGHAKYKDTAQAYGVTRVRFMYQGQQEHLEIATFRKDIQAHLGRKATKIEFSNLEQDVKRRDFTINALALDPSNKQIIDYTKGLTDLQAKIIRFIGAPAKRIAEDPLRILRAIRLKNKLGFAYHPSTKQAIQNAVAAGHIVQIATDRIRDELTRMLTDVSRANSLIDLDMFGILDILLPEVTAGKQTPQPPQYHAEGNVWQHQVLVLKKLPANPSKLLVWAALLHDIGKAVTITLPRGPADHIRYNRHYAVGAEMAKTILRRLNFSKHDITDICWMIYHHLSIDDLPNMRPSHQQKMLGHRAFADLFALHKADAAASLRPNQPQTPPTFLELQKLWDDFRSKSALEQQPSIKKDHQIDGDWLIQKFGKEYGIKPGKALGQILTELNDWYADHPTKQTANIHKKTLQIVQKYSLNQPP